MARLPEGGGPFPRQEGAEEILARCQWGVVLGLPLCPSAGGAGIDQTRDFKAGSWATFQVTLSTGGSEGDRKVRAQKAAGPNFLTVP